MCIAIFAYLIKYILVIVNLLCSLAGIVVTAIGIYIKLQLQNQLEDITVERFPSSTLNALVIGAIVVGLIILFIGFCGCCGAVTENKCLLLTYSIIMIVLASAKIYVAVVVFSSSNEIKVVAEEYVVGAFNDTAHQDVFHLIEITFQCCGTTGPESYTGQTIPVSCCPDSTSNLFNPGITYPPLDGSVIPSDDMISSLTCDLSRAYPDGCITTLSDIFTKVITFIGQIIVVIIACEYVAGVMGLLFRCYITRKQKKASHIG